MKKMNFLFIIFAVFVLSSCSANNFLGVKITDTSDNILDLTKTRYSETQLNEIALFDGNINELNEIYPIKCLRKLETNYRVAYLGERQVCVLVYNNNGDKLFSKIYKISVSSSVFDAINIGDNLDDVRCIDSDGDYIFLYTGRNDENVSTHYTSDGYVVRIYYNNLYIITNIYTELL